MTTTTSILIQEDKQVISQLGVNLIYGKDILTQIMKEWHKLTDNYLSIQELAAFFESGRRVFLVPKHDFIKDFLLTQLVADKKKLIDSSGLMISSQKLRDIVDLPDTTALDEVLAKLIYIPDVADRETIYWQAYTTKGLEVIIIESVREQLENQYRSFATTDRQKAKLLQAQQLCNQLNAIYEQFPEDFDSPLQLQIFGVVRLDQITQKLVPASGFVSYTLATNKMPAMGFGS